MSVLWTSQDAAQATKGTAIGAWNASGISIDTRSLVPGDLFIPLKDVRDGHEFIPQALAKGAAAVMSERPMAGVPALLVADCQRAMEDLGKAALSRSKAKRIAVTGSVGKTSVKTMLANALAPSGSVHASQKSFNNHWGVPLTMAQMPRETDFAVFEMGMNHEGELSHLTNLVKPDIAAITKVSEAHLQFFNSVEHIARAKAEIFEGVSSSGYGVFNAASPYKDVFLAAMQANPRTFALDADETGSDCAVINADPYAQGTYVTLNVQGQPVNMDIPFPGAHWIENTACVMLITNLVGADLNKAATALSHMSGLAGRGRSHTLNIDGKTITLIDESYNANPESMRSAIATLGLRPRRRVAVLGDMLELGQAEKALHAGLKSPLENAKIDLVLTAGPRMRALYDVLPVSIRGHWSKDADEANTVLRSLLQDGDTIMIKGSNGSGLSKIVGNLINKNNKKDAAHVL